MTPKIIVMFKIWISKFTALIYNPNSIKLNSPLNIDGNQLYNSRSQEEYI